MEKFEIIKEKIELLSEKLSNLPSKPGIYQFKDKNGKVIYVGKSKNLRNRVRSYFQIGKPQDAKTNAMIRHIFDFEIIIVDSEIEAFLLEDNLIKSLKPKYNIMLRDDKSYPYVRVTNEEFPRIFS
ncbi:MAG TPA: GIY-YIG nuclease family protein, partial [Candidatus Kapabacteria bacterium]|nr:GIY-YIG nuclease family protein [Candidatus Kapabacteria bacterium]